MPLEERLGESARLAADVAVIAPELGAAAQRLFERITTPNWVLEWSLAPRPPSEELVRSTLSKTAEDQGVTEFTARFLFSEWTYVVDAWQLDTPVAYANVPRLGRKNRMGAKQRARLWPVFAATREAINGRGFHTWAQIFAEVLRTMPRGSKSRSLTSSWTRPRIWECPNFACLRQ
jgi:hypothetical protein